jgi:CheY-like chemotaxis protein
MRTSKTVLCVDDDEDDRFLLREALSMLAPELGIVEVSNGVDALTYLKNSKQQHLPCLVILDINMPYLDGKQTLERIRLDAHLSALNIVIFTSSENPNDRRFFIEKGVDLFVKPFDNGHLQHIVQGFINTCI